VDVNNESDEDGLWQAVARVVREADEADAPRVVTLDCSVLDPFSDPQQYERERERRDRELDKMIEQLERIHAGTMPTTPSSPTTPPAEQGG
jgi:hypothetical protein